MLESEDDALHRTYNPYEVKGPILVLQLNILGIHM